MIGAPNDGIILPEDTPPNCAANVACAIDSNTDVLGGSSFTTVVRTSYFGEPDENGCEVFRLTLTGQAIGYTCVDAIQANLSLVVALSSLLLLKLISSLYLVEAVSHRMSHRMSVKISHQRRNVVRRQVESVRGR